MICLQIVCPVKLFRTFKVTIQIYMNKMGEISYRSLEICLSIFHKNLKVKWNTNFSDILLP